MKRGLFALAVCLAVASLAGCSRRGRYQLVAQHVAAAAGGSDDSGTTNSERGDVLRLDTETGEVWVIITSQQLQTKAGAGVACSFRVANPAETEALEKEPQNNPGK